MSTLCLSVRRGLVDRLMASELTDRQSRSVNSNLDASAGASIDGPRFSRIRSSTMSLAFRKSRYAWSRRCLATGPCARAATNETITWHTSSAAAHTSNDTCSSSGAHDASARSGQGGKAREFLGARPAVRLIEGAQHGVSGGRPLRDVDQELRVRLFTMLPCAQPILAQPLLAPLLLGALPAQLFGPLFLSPPAVLPASAPDLAEHRSPERARHPDKGHDQHRPGRLHTPGVRQPITHQPPKGGRRHDSTRDSQPPAGSPTPAS
jgi:hypothetical protein